MKPTDTNLAEHFYNDTLTDYGRGLSFRLKRYLASITIIWIALGLYNYLPYYKFYLSSDTQHTLLAMAFLYTVLALPMYIFLPEKQISSNRSYRLLRTIALLAKELK